MTGFLLDENLPDWWLPAICARQPHLVVWKLGDGVAPPKRTPDPVILDWCETNDAILVTNNRTSMPRHLTDHMSGGRHIPGIFLVDQKLDIEVLALTLAHVFGASLPDEYLDQILYPPLIVP
jgi:hypothetical protein